MNKEVMYADGSISTFHEGGGSSHSGYLATRRFALIAAKHALETYIKFNGEFELTRNGARNAIANVIAPLTGKTYKRSMNGKKEALADCLSLIDSIHRGVVIVEAE